MKKGWSIFGLSLGLALAKRKHMMGNFFVRIELFCNCIPLYRIKNSIFIWGEKVFFHEIIFSDIINFKHKK